MSWTALHPAGIFAGQCGEEDTMEDISVIGIDLAPAAHGNAASEAGQMAASDKVSDQPKNRLRSGGRPQMVSGRNQSYAKARSATCSDGYLPKSWK
jgi:hypothetical protein